MPGIKCVGRSELEEMLNRSYIPLSENNPSRTYIYVYITVSAVEEIGFHTAGRNRDEIRGG